MPIPLNSVHYPACAATTAPPLVIAHGLFGSSRNWNMLAQQFAQKRAVFALDLRNHGRSPWIDSHKYSEMAEDITTFIQTHIKTPVDILGHSMGGKAAMVMALETPEHVRKLMVADIAPVVYNHSYHTYLSAMAAIDMSRITRRSQAGALLAETIPDESMRGFILQNLVINQEEACWRLNLPVITRDMAYITGFPMALQDHEFTGPTLFLAGENSDYCSPKHHSATRKFFPSAEFRVLPGAGHWLHAEKPREFISEIETWLPAAM